MNDVAGDVHPQGLVARLGELQDVQFASDALRAGARAILILSRSEAPARVPRAVLAGYDGASARAIHLKPPLPEPPELQEAIGRAASFKGAGAVSPHALARRLLFANPRQTVALAIDEAQTLSHRTLRYLALMTDLLEPEAPILQIVLAAQPALLDTLAEPQFQRFRDRLCQPKIETRSALGNSFGEGASRAFGIPLAAAAGAGGARGLRPTRTVNPYPESDNSGRAVFATLGVIAVVVVAGLGYFVLPEFTRSPLPPLALDGSFPQTQAGPANVAQSTAPLEPAPDFGSPSPDPQASRVSDASPGRSASPNEPPSVDRAAPPATPVAPPATVESQATSVASNPRDPDATASEPRPPAPTPRAGDPLPADPGNVAPVSEAARPYASSSEPPAVKSQEDQALPAVRDAVPHVASAAPEQGRDVAPEAVSLAAAPDAGPSNKLGETSDQWTTSSGTVGQAPAVFSRSDAITPTGAMAITASPASDPPVAVVDQRRTDASFDGVQQSNAPAMSAARSTASEVVPEAKVTVAADSALDASSLPALAPVRVVLDVARDDFGRSDRASEVKRALAAAGVQVADVAPVDGPRPTLAIRFYFQSDQGSAQQVGRLLEPLLGPVDPAVLRKPGSHPQPGTIEITIP